MSVNVLIAIKNIVLNPINELRSYYESHNRANNMGEALENYIKDIFAGTLTETNEQKRMERFEQTFSYLGNQNNPPDIILRGGDAIEVKKIESTNSQLALNSSYPKAKLFASNPMITVACRDCETWQEKDILYAVGVVNGNHLRRLFFVYGIDYAASAGIYEKIKTVISDGIASIPGVELAETTEIGRVNRVDPLGITYLRVRGMWGIENPAKVFSYLGPVLYTPGEKNKIYEVCRNIFTHDINSGFEFAAIINSDKYDSFSAVDRKGIENLKSDNFRISDVRIKTPDNPLILRDAKLIILNR